MVAGRDGGPDPGVGADPRATMVTAGVFLVCRMSPLMEYAPEAKNLITFIGASTALFAATVGLVQTDIKRVIAYSTCSQLGYMFVAAALVSIRWRCSTCSRTRSFKAMLFLGRVVIHAMHHEQDMRNYGGSAQENSLYVLGDDDRYIGHHRGWYSADAYRFAGFLSKDAVIESALRWHQGGYGFWLLGDRGAVYVVSIAGV